MTLSELNNLPPEQLKETLARCCGAPAWVQKMSDLFPMRDKQQLLEQATSIWFRCRAQDWLEAFSHHPKIGDLTALEKKFAVTATLAAAEQAAIQYTSPGVLKALAEGNAAYEKKFGFIFIVCATGKSAGEMLNMLHERLSNSREAELNIAMKEQDKITLLRLQKLLS